MLRLLLFPFSILFDLVTRVRNHLYNIGHKPSFRFEVPVVCVGNLNVGGSGKTPMTEYLIRQLSTKHRLATLSRGYGRRTRGFRIANQQDNATTIGDEPYQVFRKFGSKVCVAVGEDRAFAIPFILHEHEDIEVIILDDAFQHRSVQPHFSVLLTEFSRPFTRDFVLPAGNLREARRGASRADAIVVTKCPPKADIDRLAKEIQTYAPGKPVFFSRISYGEPVPFGSIEKPSGKVILVTGIANPEPLLEFLKTRFEVLKHMRFNDHHAFTDAEIDGMHYEASLSTDVCLFTTEKDMVRLIRSGKVAEHRWFYIPVAMEFIENGADFDSLVRRQLNLE